MKKHFSVLLMATLVLIVPATMILQSSLVYADDFTTYRENIIGWIKNSGVLYSGNQVVEGIESSGSAWHLSSGAYGTATRTDAEGEVGLAFLYEYQATGNAWYKQSALALFHEAEAESKSAGRYPAMPTWIVASKPIYTQDNARMMKELAKAVEVTGDADLSTWLNAMVAWWNGKVGSDGSVGVGIDCINYGDHLTPPEGVSAHNTGELLIGYAIAYQAGVTSALATAKELGNWLAADFQGDHWPCPTGGLYNGGLGNLVETNSLGLRGITLLWEITGDSAYRSLADKVYGWLKQQCDNTYARWGVRVPSEYNRASDYSRFNTLYMFTPQAFIEYGSATGQNEPIAYADGILRFMCTTMTMRGSIAEGGIVGEWDFSTGSRSSFADDEGMVWGNWIYTGWTNAEAVEALCLTSVHVGPSPTPSSSSSPGPTPPPVPPITIDPKLVFLAVAVVAGVVLVYGGLKGSAHPSSRRRRRKS